VSSEVAGAVKQVGEVAAASVTVLAIVQVLPAVTAFFALIWYGVGLYEKVVGRPFSETRLAKFLSRK
jgi:hypothetical protein